MENRYQPPTAEVHDQPAAQGSAVKAVSLGLLVDIGGTLLLSVVVFSAYAVVQTRNGMSVEQIETELGDIPPTSLFFIVMTLLGCGLSVLGGYVCARIARRRDYRLGVVLGALSTTLGLLLSWSDDSAGMLAATALLSFAAIMLGTRLGMDR
jgi:hypothetical protein